MAEEEALFGLTTWETRFNEHRGPPRYNSVRTGSCLS